MRKADDVTKVINDLASWKRARDRITKQKGRRLDTTALGNAIDLLVEYRESLLETKRAFRRGYEKGRRDGNDEHFYQSRGQDMGQ